MDEAWKLIHSYSRSDALADGVLIDVSEMADEVGFRLPAAISATLSADLGGDEAVRALLLRFYWEIVSRQQFEEQEIILPNIRGDDAILHIGPDDQGEAVLTLMRPVDR